MTVSGRISEEHALLLQVGPGAPVLLLRELTAGVREGELCRVFCGLRALKGEAGGGREARRWRRVDKAARWWVLGGGGGELEVGLIYKLNHFFLDCNV